MEPNESRSLDFKKRIKLALAPHLLNPCNSKDQNDALQPVNPSNIEESGTGQKSVNPKFKSNVNIPFLCDPEKSENLQNINSSILEKAVHLDVLSQSSIGSFSGFPDSESEDGELNASENPVETNKDITSIISAHAEELAKSMQKLKIKKKKKSNLDESNIKSLKWESAIQKVLGPNSAVKSPEEVVNKESYLLHPELLESVETNPWTFHTLSKDDRQPAEDLEEVSSQASSFSRKKRHYTKEEKEVIRALRSARKFKPLKKITVNCFDGAGINCYKDSNVKSMKKQ